MAIEFTNKPIKWTNEGTAPSEDLKTNGFQAGYKPPAAVFNNQWHTTGKCIDELQTKLSSTDDKKVDKVTGKSLIDEGVANNISYYKDNSGFPHIQISPAGSSTMKSCVFSYDGLEIAEITHPSHSVILSTTEGLTIEGEMDVTLKKGASGETLHKLSEKLDAADFNADAVKKNSSTNMGINGELIFPHPLGGSTNYVKIDGDSGVVAHYENSDDISEEIRPDITLIQGSKTHKLSEKANVSDLLTKTNTTEFTPTGDYNPATKKYVDDKVDSITVPIIDNLESDSTASALSAKQGKVLDAAIATKVDKVSDKGLSSNDFTDTYKSKLDNLDTNLSAKAAKTDVLTKTNTAAFTPTGNYQPATKKYIDDTVANLPIKSLESKTLSTFYNETAIAQAGATIIGDCNERTFSTVGTEHFVKTGNIATGLYAVAVGTGTTATGNYSTAFGRKNAASGHASFAAGQDTKASGYYSTIFGKSSTALDYQFKIGIYTKDGTAGAMNSTVGDAFIIGNGVDEYGSVGVVRSNAFRVTYAGKAYGLASYSSSGADYAEYFEWKDGNPNNEDRRGKLVTLDGEKIRLATADDDYILGVVSANPCIEGDVYSDDWQGKYLTDVFGQRLTQTVHIPARYEEQEITDPETGETTTENVLIEDEHDAVQWVLNPDYDPEQEYVSREDRKEWSAIGLMGKLVVIDDGTCEVNEYCKAGVNGIATKADDGYRVMARIDDTHIRVLVR